MTSHDSLHALTDAQLLGRLSELVRQSRRVEADLIAHIGEVDARRLYLREASSSMFAYATRILHLSEAEAYLRIAVARASREHPALLTMLAAGELHLSGAALLAPHLTVANREAVLARAAHKSKRQIEELVAELAPRPEAPASIRKLPEPRALARTPSTGSIPAADAAAATDSAGSRLFPERVAAAGVTSSDTPAIAAGPVQPSHQERSHRRTGILEPIAPARYRVQFTASEDLRDKLERLQALMPGAGLAELIEQAVTEKLERLEARRFGSTKAPRRALAETAPGSRYIPAPVRRSVYERDGGRCAFVDSRGRRCNERSHLEFHHRHPHGYGGDRSPDNISLQCKPHNLHLAEIDYGKAAVERHRGGSGWRAAAGTDSTRTSGTDGAPTDTPHRWQRGQ